MTRKHEKKLKKIADKHGGYLDRRGNGHLMIVMPDGTKITTSATPTHPEISLKNLERDIRKYGSRWKA